MACAAPPVEVRGLKKTFRVKKSARELLTPWKPRRTVAALQGVDLVVRRGELVALLGPNGAGKTTLLKVLASLVQPDEGTAKIQGVDVVKASDRVRTLMGYVLAEERSFFWRLSCWDNLRFFGALQGLYGKALEARLHELGTLLGLTEHFQREFMVLSRGQKQRVAIARGMIVDPPVLLFDEATRSLDPGQAERVRRVIRELLVERGKKTVVFATHDLDEARELADRVVLLAKGRIVCEGRYEDLEGQLLEKFREEADDGGDAFERLLGAGTVGASSAKAGDPSA